MGTPGPTETEIKLPVQDPEVIRTRLIHLGFAITKPRVFEANTVYDTPDRQLRGKGCLLRLREVAGGSVVTYKGPAENSRHKTREELETIVGDGNTTKTIFQRLGFGPSFRYEKYRTEYERPSEPGVVTLDETPIGWFLELEGDAHWIDRTASELGYDEVNYITSSYGTLYSEHCTAAGIEPTDMVFPVGA